MEPNEGRLPEAHGQRIRDPHDLDHASPDQALGALAHRRLGDLQLAADLRVRAPPVQLQGLNDRLVQVIEQRSAPRRPQ
jgi:hypothetical protein